MTIAAFRPTGAGANQNKINVFQLTFSTALSDIPIITAYDNYLADSTANTVFTGVTSFLYPLIAAVGGTPPGNTNWFPLTPTVGATSVGSPNMLMGGTYKVNLSGSAPGVGGSVVFNIGWKIPYDVTPSSNMNAAIVCEYQYTGATPVITFAGNNGTEGSPSWITFDSKSTGVDPTSSTTTQIRPCSTGNGENGNATYRLNIPSSGYVYPDEIWCKDL